MSSQSAVGGNTQVQSQQQFGGSFLLFSIHGLLLLYFVYELQDRIKALLREIAAYLQTVFVVIVLGVRLFSCRVLCTNPQYYCKCRRCGRCRKRAVLQVDSELHHISAELHQSLLSKV